MSQINMSNFLHTLLFGSIPEQARSHLNNNLLNTIYMAVDTIQFIHFVVGYCFNSVLYSWCNNNAMCIPRNGVTNANIFWGSYRIYIFDF